MASMEEFIKINVVISSLSGLRLLTIPANLHVVFLAGSGKLRRGAELATNDLVIEI
jgi:hypothetical protein